MTKATTSPSRSRRDRIRGLSGAGLLRLFGFLPLGVNRFLGSGIGLMTWWGQGRTVKICFENIAKCFPEKTPTEQRELVKRSILETGRTALETTSIWRQPYERLAKSIVSVEGDEQLLKKLNGGRGVLFLAPHLGNWELLGGYLAQVATPMYMYQPTEVPEVDALMSEGRTHFGASLAPTSHRGVAMVLQHLKAGQLAAILPDQVPDAQSGRLAPFFGYPAWTMTLVHKLIQRTGCEVVTGFAQRVPGGFHLVFRESDDELHSDDLNTSLAAMNRDVERLVRMAPEQYQWEYKRYKRVDQAHGDNTATPANTQ